MSKRGQPTVMELRHRAERALESGRRREIERVLVELASLAPEGSEPAFFAHRHLAELHLERNPWRAALHLRRVIHSRYGAETDVLHALMGLCQALLGNYGYAARCYRRALRHAPGTPWYHHNLGHLLDVALNDLPSAERHLRMAYDHEPRHDEVVASLAHCVARRGRLDEARELAERAVALAPENREHRSLLTWIGQGAPSERPDTEVDVGRLSPPARGGGASVPAQEVELDASTDEGDFVEHVASLLVDSMIRSGYDPDDILKAREILDHYAATTARLGRAEVLAAAVEYSVTYLLEMSTTQGELADRYGVSRGAVGSRFRDIRDRLFV